MWISLFAIAITISAGFAAMAMLIQARRVETAKLDEM
jgi:hypothetical protein